MTSTIFENLNPAVLILIDIVIAFLLGSVVIFFIHRACVRKIRARIEEERQQEARRQTAKRLRHQKNLGDRLFNVLTEAAGQNEVYNVMRDGHSAPGFGPIRVWKIEQNGPNGYSVGVRVRDIRSPRGSTSILQADVNIEGGEFHVFYGPYGPDRTFPISDFDRRADGLAQYLRHWTLFPL